MNEPASTGARTELSPASLGRLDPRIAVPRYDRGRLGRGIVHIGVGNFHRAHLGVYLDDLFNLGIDHDWALIGAGEGSRFRLPYSGVSEKHAMVLCQDTGHWWVYDLRSRTGFEVNGVKTVAAELDDGDDPELERAATAYRKALMFEPRGHDVMSGSILYPPTRADCDIGILFIEVSGCLPMCGHGTIGTVTVALEQGFVVPRIEGCLALEVPAGKIEVEYRRNGRFIDEVRLHNIPSYLHAAEVRVDAGEPAPDESHFFLAVCAHRPQVGNPTFVYIPRAANLLREREREQPEQGGHHGHHHRTKPQAAPGDDGVIHRRSFIPQLIDVGHQPRSRFPPPGRTVR